MKTIPLDAHGLRCVAVAAVVDPRTVRQYFAGKARGTTTRRIVEALRALGREDLVHRENRGKSP